MDNIKNRIWIKLIIINGINNQYIEWTCAVTITMNTMNETLYLIMLLLVLHVNKFKSNQIKPDQNLKMAYIVLVLINVAF